MPVPPAPAIRPTWYAGRDSWSGEAWTMLHPPYTLMVLGFVIVGAAIAPRYAPGILAWTLVAYVLALGIGAHFLDQVPGMGSRYVRHWPARALWAVGLSGVGAGVAIGVAGAALVLGPWFLGLVAVQGICAIGYPIATLFRGVLHRDSVFAVSWGSLPFLTSFYAQSRGITLASLVIAAVFAAVAVLEIRLSRRSRELRRDKGAVHEDARPDVLAPFAAPERLLRGLSVGTVVVALGLLAARVLSGG
ncbi:MAG: hypothetical protein L3K15_07350 [Thermoplasmata archaeon]|nr:hypothetical protein [Thermoplasmata archaeon]